MDGQKMAVLVAPRPTRLTDSAALRLDTCRCAFSWSLRDKLRTTKRRDDILELLLPESECKWISTQLMRVLGAYGGEGSMGEVLMTMQAMKVTKKQAVMKEPLAVPDMNHQKLSKKLD